MRLFPANNPVFIAFGLALAGGVFAGPAALAQQQMPPQQEKQMMEMARSLGADIASGYRGPPAARGKPGVSAAAVQAPPVTTQTLSDEELAVLLSDPDSPQAHAEKLAVQAKRQRDLEKSLTIYMPNENMPPPPPDLEDLQNVKAAAGGGEDMLADVVEGGEDIDSALDLRRDAQKEAALSYGARGGLAKRNYEIMQRLRAFENTLDQVFNFRALLVGGPSGLLIEPPIIRESLDAIVIADNGEEAAVADRILDINKQARIVSAPRDWRLYLIQSWTAKVPGPPRILWPKSQKEQQNWNDWVRQGWKAGTQQADDMFEANLNRLVSDYNGMVRYRMLLAQGMVSQPYAMHEDRGVTGSESLMRVGDRALRITGPSQFLTTGSDLWKPADR